MHGWGTPIWRVRCRAGIKRGGAGLPFGRMRGAQRCVVAQPHSHTEEQKSYGAREVLRRRPTGLEQQQRASGEDGISSGGSCESECGSDGLRQRGRRDKERGPASSLARLPRPWRQSGIGQLDLSPGPQTACSRFEIAARPFSFSGGRARTSHMRCGRRASDDDDALSLCWGPWKDQAGTYLLGTPYMCLPKQGAWEARSTE